MNTKSDKKSKFALVILMITAIIWGFAFVAQVSGAESVPPFFFNAIRFAIGSLSLLPVIFIFEKKAFKQGVSKSKTLIGGVLCGLVLFGASGLQQYGASMIKSSGLSGFITGLYMVMIPIAYLLLFKKKTARFIWIGALVALAGLFFVCMTGAEIKNESFSRDFKIGVILLIVSDFFWTAHIMLVDSFAGEAGSVTMASVQFAVCASLSAIAAPIFETASLDGIVNALPEILYCGIMSVGVAFTLQIVGQKYADPTLAAVVMSTESVFSAIGGALFGNDKISFLGYFGGILMFCGIIISQLPDKSAIKNTGITAPEKNKDSYKNE